MLELIRFKQCRCLDVDIQILGNAISTTDLDIGQEQIGNETLDRVILIGPVIEIRTLGHVQGCGQIASILARSAAILKSCQGRTIAEQDGDGQQANDVWQGIFHELSNEVV